jgi:hypothetical protein
LVGSLAVYARSVAVVVEVVVDVCRTLWDGCVVGKFAVVAAGTLKIVAMISTDANKKRYRVPTDRIFFKSTIDCATFWS